MASYVIDQVTGEVIFLNTDLPLAPGDERNVQVHETYASLQPYVDVHGRGHNFYLAHDLAVDLASNAPAYGTGNAEPPAGEMGSPLAVDGGGGYLDALRAFGAATFGSAELGVIRSSSLALENERSGIRFGTMPRIVMRQHIV